MFLPFLTNITLLILSIFPFSLPLVFLDASPHSFPCLRSHSLDAFISISQRITDVDISSYLRVYSGPNMSFVEDPMSTLQTQNVFLIVTLSLDTSRFPCHVLLLSEVIYSLASVSYFLSGKCTSDSLF